MTSRDFCYWLQGYFEVADRGTDIQRDVLQKEQVDCIKKHLAMVFLHEIDPSFGKDKDKLNQLHNEETRFMC